MHREFSLDIFCVLRGVSFLFRSIPPTDQGTLEPADSSLPADSSPPARSPSSGGNTFWESLSYHVS